MDERIEREILIAAAPERVWPLVAEPGFWATDDDSVRGTTVTEGQSLVARHSRHGDFPMRVEKMDPPHYLAYRWVSAFPGEELREDNSTLVEYRSSGSDFKISAPGFGVILHDAGVTYADGTHHGVSAQIPFTPEVAATVCTALTS